MSARISTDIFCDDCGTWEAGGTSHKPRVKVALRIAASRGFVRIRENNIVKDLCPYCYEERKIGRELTLEERWEIKRKVANEQKLD